MKNFSLIITLLLLFSACGEGEKDTITINGHIEGLEKDTLLLYGIDKYYDRIDTLIVNQGKFSAILTADTLTDTRILFSDGTQYPLFIDKGNQITIKGNSKDLHALDINGNLPNQEFTRFQKELKTLKVPSQKELKNMADSFIQSHPFSLVSLYLLDQYFVQQPQPDIKRIQELIDGMSGELKDRPYISELQEKLKQADKGVIGKSIPYFRLPNAKDKKVGRTDYKDQYMLIHFWASWDTISCQQNAIYRRIYQKEAKNKHFALVGISLDIDRKAWKNRLKQDTLKWEQLCDFNGWETNLVEQMDVRSIPCNFLVSPNGRIEAKDLNEKEILQKIKDIEVEFKKKEKEKKQKKNWIRR